MEKTPLELYETAYRFHYADNRIADAVEYYQTLIKEFPDSNECGYAVIQLQKIKAQEVAQSVNARRLKSGLLSGPTLVIVIILFVSIAAVGGYAINSLNKKIVAQRTRTTLAIGAIAKIHRGEESEALALLSELKKLQKDDITPWELSADIYRNRKDFEKARAEYTSFFALNPGRTPTGSEKKYMSMEKPTSHSKMKRAALRPVEKDSPAVPAPPPPRPVNKRAVRRKAKTPPPPAPGKSGSKGILLVDPDSVSYF